MRCLGDGRARSREDVERRHQHRLAAARRVVGLGWWILEPPERVRNHDPDTGLPEQRYVRR